MNEEFINRLKELASSDSWADEIYSESSTVDNFAGGNVDDAFWGGHESGQIELARDVLSALNIKWYDEE
jgi:hypothetical protein